MISIGDKVTVLDDDLDGVVVKITTYEIIIETPDGFEIAYQPNELVKIGDAMQNNVLGNLREAIIEKETPKRKNTVFKEKKSRKDCVVIEIDLHIEKLVPSKKGMNNYDILTLQIETARRQLEYAIANRIPKIVFIHGVGEGVLKAELDFLLGRYSNVWFCDADYQKYGLGATEVNIRQNPAR